MAKSTRIADTTREERIRIVAEALGSGDECDGVSSSSNAVDAMYQPYIDGELELFEVNMRIASKSYIHCDDRNHSSGCCMM